VGEEDEMEIHELRGHEFDQILVQRKVALTAGVAAVRPGDEAVEGDGD
jgi:hypothetical protein